MKSFVRDSTILVSVKFFDKSDAIITPVSAAVTLHYHQNGCATHQTYDMTQSGDEWVYNWDSRDADCGVVQGHAETGGDAPISSADFEFRLIANRANREASGD